MRATRRTFLEQTTAAGVVLATSLSTVRAIEDEVPAIAPSKVSSPKRNLGERIKSVARREDTLLRHGGHGGNWHMSWASDDRQFVSLCDGAGFSEPPSAVYNSRMLSISGGPHEAKFHDVPGYPMLGAPTQGQKDTRYYNFGTLALDGHLYQFMSTYSRPLRADEMVKPDYNNAVRFTGVKLIYSPDNGRTWHNQDGSTPVVWESWDQRSRNTLVFFEEDQDAFSLLTVLQMGRNYEHNRDGYVYVYAPNGNTDGTMNELVMFRVPKADILNRRAYEFFSDLKPDGNATWSKDINARKPVHIFPRGWVNKLMQPYAWHPSVVYNAPLGVYMMANWGMGTGTDDYGWSGIKATDMWFAKPSYLGFWIAPDPWGPWTQIHEETAWLPGGDAGARAHQPQIAPKWIAADGKSFWLVWTDFQMTDRQAMQRFADERTRKIESNSRHVDSGVAQKVAMMRKYMPYYAFNAQRVDLITA